MVRNSVKVLLVDVVLLAGEYLALQDLGWRSAYAASPHSACLTPCGYSASFGYNLLTRFFTMAGHGVSLTSPPTLDWVQLLAFALLAVNAWFAYGVFRSRKVQPAASQVQPS